MTTFTADRAAAGFPVFKGTGAGLKQAAFGTIEVAANPVAADLYKMCKVPAGATVTGGCVYADSLDTNASATLDLDLGWAANGGSGTYDAIDADGLGNWGVWDDAVIAQLKPVLGHWKPLGGILLLGDFPTFTEETTIQFTTVATAATFAAGALSCVIEYVTGN